MNAGTTRTLRQASFDTLAMLRNGEQLLLVLVLPALALLAGAAVSVPDLGPHRVDVLVPGVLALAVLSTAFTGQAIALAFDRRAGVLRLLATTPLGPSGLVLGRILAVVTVEIVQLAVLGGIGLAAGWRPEPAGLPAAVLLAALGTVALAACGLLLASLLRPEAVLAVANLVWVLLLGLGAVVVPASAYGRHEAWARPAALLPSGALAEGLRAALGQGRLDAGALLVLLVWAAGATTAAVRLARWD
ncbi:MAG: ABC transporter permease [Kineosporiaceae bacterium]